MWILYYNKDECNIIKCKAVIIATGAIAKKLNFINSELYWNKGISALEVEEYLQTRS